MIIPLGMNLKQGHLSSYNLIFNDWNMRLEWGAKNTELFALD